MKQIPPEPKDKRTKKYKEWAKKYKDTQEKKSKGLGDTIEKITKATGIKKAVEFIAGEDCGCDKRKEYLNRVWRYRKPQCPTEKHFNFMVDFFKKGRPYKITNEQQIEVNAILSHVFQSEYEKTSCTSCLRNRVRELERIYKSYEN